MTPVRAQYGAALRAYHARDYKSAIRDVLGLLCNLHALSELSSRERLEMVIVLSDGGVRSKNPDATSEAYAALKSWSIDDVPEYLRAFVLWNYAIQHADVAVKLRIFKTCFKIFHTPGVDITWWAYGIDEPFRWMVEHLDALQLSKSRLVYFLCTKLPLAMEGLVRSYIVARTLDDRGNLLVSPRTVKVLMAHVLRQETIVAQDTTLVTLAGALLRNVSQLGKNEKGLLEAARLLVGKMEVNVLVRLNGEHVLPLYADRPEPSLLRCLGADRRKWRAYWTELWPRHSQMLPQISSAMIRELLVQCKDVDIRLACLEQLVCRHAEPEEMLWLAQLCEEREGWTPKTTTWWGRCVDELPAPMVPLKQMWQTGVAYRKMGDGPRAIRLFEVRVCVYHVIQTRQQLQLSPCVICVGGMGAIRNWSSCCRWRLPLPNRRGPSGRVPRGGRKRRTHSAFW